MSVTTGEMYFTHTDAIVGRVEIARSYNSARVTSGRYGAFGPGWNASFDQRLKLISTSSPTTPQALELRLPDGTPMYYVVTTLGSGLYTQEIPYGRDAWIEETATGYRRTLRRGGGTEEYDTAGRLLAVIALTGQRVDYGYTNGKLTSITRENRSVTVDYDATFPERPSQLVSGGTPLVTYSYEQPNGRLKGVDYPGTNGTGYHFHYDPAIPTRLLTVTDSATPPNPIEAHEYDAHGRAWTSEIADGVERLTLTFPSAPPSPIAPQGQTTVTDALNNVTVYKWKLINLVRRVTEIAGPCGSCGGSAQIRKWGYNNWGQITSYDDGVGTTNYIYDANTGDLIEERKPLGQTTVYTYWPDGRVKTVTAPNGALTEYTYLDGGPDLIKEHVAPPPAPLRQTDLDYTPDGRLEWITDALGNKTKLGYDSTTRDLTSVTGPLGTLTPNNPNDHVTRFEYDPLSGRRTAVIDPLGKRTETLYDVRGRVTRTRRLDGTRPIDTTYAYPSRLVTTITDPNLHVTDQIKDTYGRLWKVQEPTVNSVRAETIYGYDSMSNLASITDAENHTTEFDPDAFNRIGLITYPGGQTEAFTYDTGGRLWTRTRGNVTTTYGYDSLHRLTSRTYSDGTAAFTFAYDANGDVGYMTSAAHDSRSLAWDYDLAGQMMSEVATSPVAPTSTVSYHYDLLGRREWVKLAPEATPWLTYEYDPASRLDKMWRGTKLYDFTLNDADYRTAMAYPNGVVTTYGYDDLWRLRTLSAATSGPGMPPVIVHAVGYTYTDDGNRETKTLPGLSETYLYDPMERLKQHGRNGGMPVGLTYDEVGNREPGVWVHNVRNQLISNPDFDFTYDQGNLVSKSGGGHAWTYEWNGADQLKRVTRDQVEVATYAYDPLGRRVARNAAGRAHTYVYDHEDILREDFSSALEEPGLIDPPPHRYIHGPGIDEPLGVVHGTGTTWYFHADGLGSVLGATDSLGAPVFSRQYDVWGNPEATTKDGYAFTGREWDEETGLYYYRARYYDPKIGRFISEDPLPVEVREVDELNAYAYVSNSPINYTDPLGVSKGGKKNIGAEDFTKQSKAADVQKALDQAVKLRQVKRIKALKALLKVIKRGGAMGLVGGLTLDWTLDDYLKDLEEGRCERTQPDPQPAPPPPPPPNED